MTEPAGGAQGVEAARKAVLDAVMRHSVSDGRGCPVKRTHGMYTLCPNFIEAVDALIEAARREAPGLAWKWEVSEEGNPTRRLQRAGQYVGLIRAEHAQSVVDALNMSEAYPPSQAGSPGRRMRAVEGSPAEGLTAGWIHDEDDDCADLGCTPLERA